MAEIALGVLGVAGLFSATLDVWSFVDAGQDYALSFTRLRTRLDLQRTLFVNWGKGVGFGSEEGYHPKLDDPGTQPIVRQVLTEIYLVLSETDSLTFKYGVRMLDENEERRRLVAIPRRILSLGRSASVFRPRYEEFRLLFRRRDAQGSNGTDSRTHPAQGVELAAAQQRAAIRERQRNSSIWAKARWAIRDEGKMERLVHDLAELVGGLRALTADIVDDEKEMQIAEQTVSDIDNVSSLRQIQEASPEASPLSASVSERIRSLESSISGTRTFFSARSRLSEGALDDSVYGTSRPSQGSCFPRSVFSDHMDRRALESAPSGNLPRRTSTLETVAESDAFAIDEYPTPSYAVNKLPHFQETDGAIASPDPAWPPADPDHRPFETMLVSGPADTPYSGGQFRVQVWLGLTERAEMDGEEVKACHVYVRFLTRICHPLVDTDGYVHARLFTTWHPKIEACDVPNPTSKISRMLRYCHWTGIDATFDGEADCIEGLESKAHSWTKKHAKPMFSQGSLNLERGSDVLAPRDDELPPVSYPSHTNLEGGVWKAQGAHGTTITLLGYPAVQTWEEQLMPEVRLSWEAQ